MEREEVIRAIIGAFYLVYNTLGTGFLEKNYENAMAIELREQGFLVQQQAPIKVFYKEQSIGEYFADLLVSECVIVELKVASSISPQHEAQLLNYLKATEIDLGILLNFGPKAEFRRKIYETARKR